ncbi:MAG: hypothetical protein LBJ04_22630 [Sphingobacterium sp.]|jgi:hypothetical protein|nr:hypothetical protein [Sphingobacterium sp.]
MKTSVKNKNVVVATTEGRLYIRTVDFFKQDKIKETIERLKNSKIVKEIDEKNKLAGV